MHFRNGFNVIHNTMRFLADNQQVKMHPLTGCANTRELKVFCEEMMLYEAGDGSRRMSTFLPVMK
jgi:hypothetical protein